MRKFSDRTGNDLYLRSISGIEKFHDYVKQAAFSRSVSFSPANLSSMMTPELARKYLRFLYAQYEIKYADLTGGLIESANNKNYLVFALCGRSLLEITAVLRYYNNKLLAVLGETTADGELDHEQTKRLFHILDSHARGGKFNWHEFHFGERSRFANHLVEERKKRSKSHSKSESASILDKTNPSQVNVLTAVDSWAKENAAAQLSYDFFCELVHPNLGSNFLVMGSRRDELVIGKSSSKNIARGLYLEGLSMIAATAIREATFQMGALLVLSEAKESNAPDGAHPE
jgi:hypothetical protein